MGRRSQELMLGRTYAQRKTYPRGVRHTKWIGTKRPNPIIRQFTYMQTMAQQMLMQIIAPSRFRGRD